MIDSPSVGVTGDNAVFNQTGGSNTVLTRLLVGYGTNATYNLSGTAWLTVNLNEVIGSEGNATFNQCGGTQVVASLAVRAPDFGADATGTYNLSGGVLIANVNETIGTFGFGQRSAQPGPGLFYQTGGKNTAGSLTTSRANVRQIVFPILDSEYRVETAADDSVRPAWEGAYRVLSDFLPVQDVMPGNAVQVSAASRGANFSGLVREVDVQVISLAADRSQYDFKFSNDAADPLAAYAGAMECGHPRDRLISTCAQLWPMSRVCIRRSRRFRLL